VTTKTKDMLSELRKWCDAEHGRRSELARIIDVKPQTLSNWLVGRNAPSSEATLKLIEFLKDPEAHRKPGRGLK
jgi:DNA-binding transcriptional regulator YiaG